MGLPQKSSPQGSPPWFPQPPQSTLVLCYILLASGVLVSWGWGWVLIWGIDQFPQCGYSSHGQLQATNRNDCTERPPALKNQLSPVCKPGCELRAGAPHSRACGPSLLVVPTGLWGVCCVHLSPPGSSIVSRTSRSPSQLSRNKGQGGMGTGRLFLALSVSFRLRNRDVF